MNKKIQLSLRNENGEEEQISGEIDETDFQVLEEFILYANELIETKLVKSGMQFNLKISWEQDSAMKVTSELPPWEDVIVFLYKIRPILLQRDRTNFNRVVNILSKNLDNAKLRSYLSELRKIYSGKRMQEVIKISSNAEIINSEKVLLDWLNAEEYHRDKDKKAHIDDLYKAFPENASKTIFLNLLRDKTLAIHRLAVICRVVTGQSKEIQLQVNATQI